MTRNSSSITLIGNCIVDQVWVLEDYPLDAVLVDEEETFTEAMIATYSAVLPGPDHRLEIARKNHPN